MFLLVLASLGMAEDSVVKTSSPETTSVQSRDFGMGFSMGTPTGFGCKLYLDKRARVLQRGGYAIQAAVGGDLGSVGDVAVSADALYQTKPLNQTEDGYRLPIYYGVGLTGGVNTQQNMMRAGVRGIAGLVVAIDDLPFELAIESGISLLVVDTASGNSLSHMMLGQLAFRHF